MDNTHKFSYGLTLGALGVVFGDIGTSPLYALKVTLNNIAITQSHILGVLSLIFWCLILVISFKYLILILRADNDGEGGILALLALMKYKSTKYTPLFYIVAIFGAGLLLGDGMLTPAISVISAVEGLSTLSDTFTPFILPIAVIILILLFTLQARGTGSIGNLFGPIILVWFFTIAILGIIQIAKAPIVLTAINPYYAFDLIRDTGLKGYLLLGGIFLVVTGGEALYADIGHFGKNPIRAGWFAVVLPCLILNYFGQGANLLLNPHAISNPFYMIAPEWFYIPLIILATIATIIASQAVISATFSLTKQAVLLSLCPRIPIVQTSREFSGQIYVPQINFILFIGTLTFCFAFKTSDRLAHAYGIAVNADMLLIDAMVAYAALSIWKWSKYKVITIFGLFLIIDFAFLGSNLHKFLTGGWVPVTFALIIATIMYTWKFGLEYLRENYYMNKDDISKILRQLEYKSLNQLTDLTAVFITDVYDKSGGSFLHFLKLSRAVPERVLIVNYVVDNIPYIHYSQRYEITCLHEKVFNLTLHYGFMETISIPRALERASNKNLFPFKLNVDRATYMVEIPNITASKSKKSLTFYWQEKLFAFLIRNYSANLNIDFYKLPYNRTMAIGTYYIM
ncbi:KUP/HAK/KT family potassium transporter [Fluoribacter gormanii]|uniref:Probable potassium transport system protein Kup n=1 Tax=Fluoribacter gormanii TaxID=464 RepID=A0ABY1JW64_9GAMM|nr:KUP/HAK/KT family potassium transporter [Fluoribacter gormanii]KTD00942.1 low affinity potassium transport system protein Kup [Fluoribacter gormanii]MCW8443402.1 KUP/HAK/KT family potassium transporter [Fluoribacter gormanii]MCW8471830.1 KUP/HAK/KT family potassium transporter [Fluoribacter gormanii]SIQ82850.1 KUP system potassium uptake protein [Fluoribacter gormanii]